MNTQDFIVLEKEVGETPLQCAEAWRATRPDLADVPLAYAGRLDPMASGKLLILIGEECKQQEKYHGLDKEYVFEVLLGVQSDTGDVLGLISTPKSLSSKPSIEHAAVKEACKKLTGQIELPYPHYSSKTVQGKPLHVWALEGRLNEITIPTKASNVYKITLESFRSISADAVYKTAAAKIETIPPVTELSKALGNDFRRPDVRQSWSNWHDEYAGTEFQIATVRCIASSGTYMRTLAEVIGRELGTTGLAYSIHRTEIGQYKNLPFGLGIWHKRFTSR